MFLSLAFLEAAAGEDSTFDKISLLICFSSMEEDITGFSLQFSNCLIRGICWPLNLLFDTDELFTPSC